MQSSPPLCPVTIALDDGAGQTFLLPRQVASTLAAALGGLSDLATVAIAIHPAGRGAAVAARSDDSRESYEAVGRAWQALDVRTPPPGFEQDSYDDTPF